MKMIIPGMIKNTSPKAIRIDEIKKTPNEFLKSVQPMPVRKGNRVEGYRLRSRDAALDLSKLGLQSGDVVTHIGGEDLRQGAPRFQQIFQRIEQNPANATLTVNRDGQTVTLNLN